MGAVGGAEAKAGLLGLSTTRRAGEEEEEGAPGAAGSWTLIGGSGDEVGVAGRGGWR